MTTRSLQTAFLVAVAMAMAGCQGAAFRMAQVPVDSSLYEVKGPAEVKTTGLLLFGFIPINLNNRIERAVSAGIALKGGDQMVDIEVQESYFWAYVLTGHRVNVKGTVIKKKM